MEFTFTEKLAVINIIVDVIKVDGEFHTGEMKFIERLKKDIGFDIPFVEAAEDMDKDTALKTLYKLSTSKKKKLVQILKEVAISDDFLHEKEMDLIISTLINIGLGEELD